MALSTVPPPPLPKCARKPEGVGAFFDSVKGMFETRTRKERNAAFIIQKAARGMLGRLRARRLRAMRRYVFLMARQERKCAMLIQARWRDHCGLPQPSMLELQEEMASLIQAAKRGRDVRKSIKNEKMANEYNQNRAAKVIQRKYLNQSEKSRILAECKGVMEKQGRKYGVSKWEVVVWQERYVHLTESSLVYQRLASSGEPKGKEKEVPFASMQTVKAILGPVLSHLYIKATTREFFFQLASQKECERWAKSIVELTQCVGYKVPGFVVMASEELTPPQLSTPRAKNASFASSVSSN